MTREEYIAQCAPYRDIALKWFSSRTKVKDGVFKSLHGGIEYPVKVIGICPTNRTYVGQFLKTDGGIEAGMLLHCNDNSTCLALY